MASPAEAALTFSLEPNPAPASDATRAAVLANPGFGTHFTDHMVTIDWSEGTGWHDAKVSAYAPIPLDPAAAVLHYAQEIFEGLKAYKQADSSISLFRPDANAERFNQSATRLAMPTLPESLFIEAIEKLVELDKAWIPDAEGASLYLRPFMIATEAFLGVRPAKTYKFILIASPAGNYFKSGAPAVSIWVSDYTRAAPGGTGAAKCGGNYAASLVPQGEALARGHDQVVFLDAAEHKWIEELGGMNLFYVFDDGTILTPALTGTILPGITRRSLIALLREEGLTVNEGRYSLDQWREDATSGKLVETFACGTAAVVTAVGKVAGNDGEFTIGSGGPGQLTEKVKARLVAIQRGQAEDTHGWVRKIA
ncbi:branched-chain amino acid aminotransferase [Novosphingobium decolorationis]|uniref:Branched-chain-amino-acid aminotransferase n=1 Tax=Novosphingobium decolorationis TaxID=2698673 RepID=A0ABX8EAP5_9SPHN|nr:branched-chain amino acid aminotransferase [Novosphingobium decolorationis]MED5546934.1 branched-chain amino acid aminotransferase [Pseudomonadota bacterium]QVM85654.1 branched-chain amino acid aminotransferase [Novosphingobium decolorationis]